MFGKLHAKACATLLFTAGELVSLVVAWLAADKYGWSEFWAAALRTANAQPTFELGQRSILLTIVVGLVVFVVCSIFSFLAAELYYWLLKSLKRPRSEHHQREHQD